MVKDIFSVLNRLQKQMVVCFVGGGVFLFLFFFFDLAYEID